MKVLILSFISITFILGCNYKELGCISCRKRTTTTITRFDSGKIKTIYKSKSICKRVIDGPAKHQTKILEFDEYGNVVFIEKSSTVLSVWNFENPNSKRKWKIYFINNDSIKKETHYFKNGELIKRIIKRK